MLSSFQNNFSILFHDVSIIEFHSHLSINFGYPSVQKLDLSSISFTSCTMEFRESYPTATKATRILSTLMDCLSWQFHQADVRSKPLVDIRKTPTRNIKEVNVVDVLEITRKKIDQLLSKGPQWPLSSQRPTEFASRLIHPPLHVSRNDAQGHTMSAKSFIEIMLLPRAELPETLRNVSQLYSFLCSFDL